MEFAIILLIGILIIIIYNILNYIEMRFIENEYKSLKIIVKENIIILLSSLFSLWIYINYEQYFVDFFSIIMNKTGQQIGNIVNTKNKINDIPVFTDLPDF